MDWLLWVVGGFGTLAVACGFAFWRYLQAVQKEAVRAAVLQSETANNNEVINAVKKAKDTRDRLRSDRDFARRMRERYTRDD